jgi:membrane protein implicated in regulation of membrane protease activity
MSSLVHFLVAWTNAPYTVAGGVAVLFAAMRAIGVFDLVAGGDGDHDGDHEGDHDGGGDDSDGDDHDAADDDRAAHPASASLPGSLRWQIFAVVLSAVGLSLHARGFPAAPTPGALLWSLPLSALAAYAVTRALGRLLAPLFSSDAQAATSRAALVGKSGVVISTRVTAEFGEIRVRDRSGHDLRLICRLADGAEEAREHEEVVVVERRGDELLVAKLPNA